MSPRRLLPPGLLLAASLAGCAQIDPYTREGMWQPEGVNSVNLAVSVANPSDLLRGHGAAGPQPVLATNAVRRLLAGVPAPLPQLSDDTNPGSGGSAAPAPTPAAGAGGSAPPPAATGTE
jgi:hypothetical protein